MDATVAPRAPALRWPATLARWGVTPAVAGLWAWHELLMGAAAAVPVPSGPSPIVSGLPWFRWDVGWYARIAHASYAHLPAYYAAYFPGVPAYLWVTHSSALAFVGIQIALLGLLVQVGRLAASWGLTGWRVTFAQALVALSPAAIFYSTAYPEVWEALGICGALLAMRASRPGRAAAWSALAGVMDPLGMLVGVGAGAWALWGLLRREWPVFRQGIAWGLGSAAALGAVSATLWANGLRPLGFIGAQRAWGAHWLVPGVQIWQALIWRGPELDASLAALAALPLVVAGLVTVVRAGLRSAWHAATAGITIAIVLVSLAFYTNRAPLSSAARFFSLAIPGAVALAGVFPRRYGVAAAAWYSCWAIAGAVLFTHGWFWG